jgi:hypothetical protein
MSKAESPTSRVVAQLREKFGLEVVEDDESWELHIPRGEILFEILIPRDCFEWFVTVKEKASGKELWDDWMEHYGGTPSELETEMDEAISHFVERLLKSEVRMVKVWKFFRRRLVPEWYSDGHWERLALVWEFPIGI